MSDIDPRTDDFYKMFRKQDLEKTTRIIGPGPFYCSFCGKRLVESGHMMEKFFLCEDAGEFTWNPSDLVRVEIDGTSYAVAGQGMSVKEIEKQRQYYEMCADAHKRSADRRKEETPDPPTYERRQR